MGEFGLMKKINFARIMQRITDKFKLSQGEYSDFELSETVIPTTDIDKLIVQNKTTIATVSATGTGWLLMYTVPTGKRIKPKSIFGRISSGTYTYSDIGIEQRDNSSSQVVVHTQTGAATMFKDFANNLQLEQGDKIYFFIATHSVTGNAQIQMAFEEEDAF